MAGLSAPLGYYWGDDGYAVSHGPDALAVRLAADGDAPERWRVVGDATTADEIGERVATSTLFGAGTLVVVIEPAPLVSSKALAARLGEVLATVAPGNALAFLETFEGRDKDRPAALVALERRVAEMGGEVRRFAAPRQHEMGRWIQERAAERGISIEPPAAALLAERVGAFVREQDVDRRRQSELAVGELEKLALYRLDRPIRVEDVRALVADAVPGSTWAFLDAVATRRAGEAAQLLQKLSGVPGPVLVVHLHRTVRELLLVGDMVAKGETGAAIVRSLKLNPYIAEKRSAQVRGWSLPELDRALAGLLELDASIKRQTDSLARVGVELWLAECVAPAGQRPRATAK